MEGGGFIGALRDLQSAIQRGGQQRHGRFLAVEGGQFEIGLIGQGNAGQGDNTPAMGISFIFSPV